MSAGSIEYWPDPQRGDRRGLSRAQARAGARGDRPRAARRNRLLRALADTWMLFPSEAEYRGWMERAGFADVALVPLAPDWYRSRSAPYAVAVAG